MTLFKDVSPRKALRDLRDYIAMDRPHRITALLLALTVSGVGGYLFLSAMEPEPDRRPKITYVKSFPPGRTDADIEADWKKRAIAENERRAKIRARYRWLAEKTGVDYTPAPGTENDPKYVPGQTEPKAAGTAPPPKP